MGLGGDRLHIMVALAALGYAGGLIAIACNSRARAPPTVRLQVENEWLVRRLIASRDEALGAAREAQAANRAKTELCETSRPQPARGGGCQPGEVALPGDDEP